MPIFSWGQTYSALWKKVAEAEQKDLPQTEYEVLQQIVKKATEEKAYGQLLKAELKAAQAQASVAPDSLAPAVKRLEARCQALSDEVLKTVYRTVLYTIYSKNSSLEVTPVKPELTPALCDLLAQCRDESYKPFVLMGKDSKLFNHDLLSIIGYAIGDYQVLADYYAKSGNRPAACLTALEVLRHGEHESNERYIHALDALTERYADLPEAGEVAIERYNAMESQSDITAAEKIAFVRKTIATWPDCRLMNKMRNEETELTNPKFSADIKYRIALPNRPQTVSLSELRNLKSLSMKVYRVKANGDIDLNPNNENDFKQLKSLLTPMPEASVERTYQGRADYEVFDDELTLQSLPAGVYMLEFTSNPTTETERSLYFVTDLYTMSEKQPDGKIRYVVVNATTGQPIAKAHLRIKEYTTWKDYKTHNLTTDKHGEAYLQLEKDRRCEVYAYTDGDKAAPEINLNNRYNYYEKRDLVTQTCIYTDRAIYRPGQTVHVAAVVYEVHHGIEHSVVPNKPVTFTLYGSNFKEVAHVRAVTDEYGTCSAELTLPSSGLTGSFSLSANDQRTSIRVEEYKRPTFEIEYEPVNVDYKAGDTVRVKGEARSYAGVPIQETVVKYKVMRRLPLWWWSYSRYWDMGLIGNSSEDVEISSGETQTGEDGSFCVDVPLQLPESRHPLFYNFVVTADVTDVAGETHSAQFSLPIGNRKTALSIELAEKILKESQPTMSFHLRNAAGNDIDADVEYRIDGGSWQKTKTIASLPLPVSSLSSGWHKLEARFDGDTVERRFMLFSVDDKRPADDTDDWFWLSDSQFSNDGKPVTLQVGSSRNDVHIVYSIFADKRCLESGSVDKNGELINRKFKYKEEWGDGILLTFAWVKENMCYTHSATIRRPLPDKWLKMSWKTFRDRLTPGQQEEWTLTVEDPDGKPADASLMAVLYDKSLDQLASHYWGLTPYISLAVPNGSWTAAYRGALSVSAARYWNSLGISNLKYSRFDESVYPSPYNNIRIRGFGNRRVLSRNAGMVLESAPVMAYSKSAALDEEVEEDAMVADLKETAENFETAEETAEDGTQQVQIRENLNETAFFYPQLTTDSSGVVALKFTLPESLTTWRFMSVAHTRDMCHGFLSGETVAKKDVMIQPNMPRFVREGDEAVVSARIFNTSDRTVKGRAVMRLLVPETEAVAYETALPFTADAGATASVSFSMPLSTIASNSSLYICQVMAQGDGFSDGEQHYLPVLPASERVTVTVPFTQIEPGKKQIDLAALLPADGKNPKLTFEYTNNPAWLMIQALPTVGKPIDDNAVSQAASLYANTIGRYILAQNPKAKTVFQLWAKEKDQVSLTSSLEKNMELKDLLLGETPWVLDAERESEQKQRMADFFDTNIMQQRLASAVEKLNKLQKSDGAWTWWPGMPGSFYMTVAISEMLVRLNTLTGKQAETSKMLSAAFRFMGKEIVEDVNYMKRQEKKGIQQNFPSFKALQWLYLATLDGRDLPSDVKEANNYLYKLLKKDIKRQTMYEKAMTAIILAKSLQLTDADRKRALEYVQSLKEYTVYREEMGRYYDTPRAGYSWYDYKIPTQTMAIEALQLITPDDRLTIQEMQRWLLQSKRTQAWDTPINSVNAVYAFLNGAPLALTAQNATVTLDDKPLDMPEATAAIGYVKTPVAAEAKQLVVDKTSEGTSWGAVYAQFTQATKNIKDTGNGLTVQRELLTADGQKPAALKVGDRVKMRITIVADRDFDFVQVIDRKAACLEPVRQLSGYHSGSYCTPRDNSTNYYFDLLSKGKHVIETEYFIDRPGVYETGTCTVSCAYAPEFRGTTKSQTLNIVNK